VTGLCAAISSASAHAARREFTLVASWRNVLVRFRRRFCCFFLRNWGTE
jgi:hypothetical protein